MYAITLTPQIDRVTQTWYADDAAATSDISTLHKRWGQLINSGPAYGYIVNASKSQLIVKASHNQLSEALNIFEDTQVNLTSTGKPHFEAPLGTHEFIELFVKRKLQTWSDELIKLATIANVTLMLPMLFLSVV